MFVGCLYFLSALPFHIHCQFCWILYLLLVIMEALSAFCTVMLYPFHLANTSPLFIACPVSEKLRVQIALRTTGTLMEQTVLTDAGPGPLGFASPVRMVPLSPGAVVDRCLVFRPPPEPLGCVGF